MKSSGATSFQPQRLMVMCQRLMASRKVAAKAVGMPNSSRASG